MRDIARTLYADEHEQFRSAFRSWLDNEVVPHHEQYERDGITPRELWLAAGSHGFLGLTVPEQYGGGGTDDYRFAAVMQEEVSYTGVIGSANGFTLHNDIVLPYFIGLCNDEQKARWLPGMVSGERIGAIAMTEPNTGSDLANIRTTAVRHGDTYLVNGSKTFITNGINSDAVIVAVKTDSEAKHRGISLIVLERGMNGFERGRNLDKLGMHAHDLLPGQPPRTEQDAHALRLPGCERARRPPKQQHHAHAEAFRDEQPLHHRAVEETRPTPPAKRQR